MSEQSDKLTKQEMDKFLLSDLTIDDIEGQNAPVQNSKVLETGDRIFASDMERINQLKLLIESCSPLLSEEASANEWHYKLAHAVSAWMRENTIDGADEASEGAYRETVKRIRGEHARQLNEVGKLVTELYLDFQYIKRVASVLMQFAGSQSPEAIRTVASLIDYQSAGSLTRIQDHNQTAHYPSSLIQSHERTTTEQH